MTRLGLSQHLPVLVHEEMSLDVLKLLPTEDLHTHLSEMRFSRGVRCTIVIGLRDLTATGIDQDPDSATMREVTGTTASSATTTTATTPEWFYQGFEDVS